MVSNSDMIQGAQEHLEASLANSAAFQSFIGVNDAEQAARHVYHDILPSFESDEGTADDLTAIRPFALIYTEENESGYAYQRDGTGCWRGLGMLALKFERAIPEGGTPENWDREFRMIMGNIVREIAQQAETAGRLAAERIIVQGPYRIQEEQVSVLGDFQWYEMLIAWGQ